MIEELTKKVNEFAAKTGLGSVTEAEMREFMGVDASSALDNLSAHLKGDMSLQELANAVGYEFPDDPDELDG